MTPERRDLCAKALSGFLWTGLAMGAQSLMQLVSIVILARLLTPDEFGLFLIGMVILGFSAIFSELGVGPAIVQRQELGACHIRTGFTVAVLSSIAVAAGIAWSSVWIAGFFQKPALAGVVKAACVVLVMQGFSTVAQSLALRSMRFRWLAGVDAVSFTAGFVFVAPVLAWFGFGVWALVGAYLTQYALKMIMLLAGVPHAKRPLIDLGACRTLLYFGAGFSLARVGNYVAGQADKLIVGRFIGTEALGLYGHAYQLMYAPALLVGQAMDRVLFPTMAAVQVERERLARAYRTGISACALFIVPLSVCMIVAADELVDVLLGANWLGVALPMQVLAVGMLFRTSYKISDSISRALGAVYRRAWRQWIYAGAIMLGALVGQIWGVAGVAAGVVCAITLNYLLMADLSLRLTQMTWGDFGRAHVPAAMLGSIVGASAWSVAEAVRGSGGGAPATIAAVGGVCVAVTVLAWSVWPAIFLGRDAAPLVKRLRESIGGWIAQRLQVSRAPAA